MRSFIRAISVFSVAMFLLPLNTEANNTINGTYEPSIVLTAPWGEKNLFEDKIPSKPGKIGFGYNSQGLECGPTAFTISRNGDIYISDILNRRIQRFDSNGNFLSIIPNVSAGAPTGMCIDKEGNIYTGKFYSSKPYIKQFDQQGNLIKTYWIVKDSELETDKSYKWGGGGSIYVDDSNRVFIVYQKGVLQVGTKDSVFTPEQQKASLRPGLYGYTANVPDMYKGSEMYDLLGQYVAPSYLFGMDQDYVYTWMQDEKDTNMKILDITDYELNPIASYRLDPKLLKCKLLTVFNMGKTISFNKGNIYVFCSDKEGVKIIKLSAVEGGK